MKEKTYTIKELYKEAKKYIQDRHQTSSDPYKKLMNEGMTEGRRTTIKNFLTWLEGIDL